MIVLWGRGDLTEALWARLAPLLPVGIKSGRPPVHSKRQLIDGIRWRVRVRADRKIKCEVVEAEVYVPAND